MILQAPHLGDGFKAQDNSKVWHHFRFLFLMLLVYCRLAYLLLFTCIYVVQMLWIFGLWVIDFYYNVVDIQNFRMTRNKSEFRMGHIHWCRVSVQNRGRC